MIGFSLTSSEAPMLSASMIHCSCVSSGIGSSHQGEEYQGLLFLVVNRTSQFMCEHHHHEGFVIFVVDDRFRRWRWCVAEHRADVGAQLGGLRDMDQDRLVLSQLLADPQRPLLL